MPEEPLLFHARATSDPRDDARRANALGLCVGMIGFSWMFGLNLFRHSYGELVLNLSYALVAGMFQGLGVGVFAWIVARLAGSFRDVFIFEDRLIVCFSRLLKEVRLESIKTIVVHYSPDGIPVRVILSQGSMSSVPIQQFERLDEFFKVLSNLVPKDTVIVRKNRLPFNLYGTTPPQVMALGATISILGFCVTTPIGIWIR